jgi:GGDEF domain-containing protein
MTRSRGTDESLKVLTPDTLSFVLSNELKRAVRSQNFLTLVLVEANREWDGITMTADEGTLQEVAQLIGDEVRDSDLLGQTDEKGTLALLLLDSDFDNSTRVIERVISRIENYEFLSPMRIAVGAACYPTHAVDVDALKRRAMSRPIAKWRAGHGFVDSPRSELN